MTPSNTFGQLAAISKLISFVVVIQTAVAILITYVANRTNTSRLGILVLFIWLLVSITTGLWYRRKLGSSVVSCVLLAAWVFSFVAYILIGYFGLGWTGLIKSLNG